MRKYVITLRQHKKLKAMLINEQHRYIYEYKNKMKEKEF
jgi:hypothetical protein